MSELTNDQYIHRLEEDNAILEGKLKASQYEVKRLREALKRCLSTIEVRGINDNVEELPKIIRQALNKEV